MGGPAHSEVLPVYALVFDGLPRFVEKKKGLSPDTTRVFGATLYADEVVRAFLRYGTADSYRFLDRGVNRGLGAWVVSPDGSNTEVLGLHSVGQITDTAELVLFSFRATPQDLVPVRRYFRRPWPIVGVIHAMSDVVASDLAWESLADELKPFDAIVCSSQAGRTVLHKLATQAQESLRVSGTAPMSLDVQTPVIPLGVDCDSFRGSRGAARAQLAIGRQTRVVLCFGRLTPHAKADLGPLLLGWGRLVQEISGGALLIIAGDDTRHSMAGDLERYVGLLGCSDSVRVIPDIDARAKRVLFAAADVFVAPSDHVQETFGISVIEALASGLPVVAADWSGFREIVDDGVTGYLVPTQWLNLSGGLELVGTCYGSESRNTVLAGMTIIDYEVLMCRLRDLLLAPKLRTELGRRARETARSRFDWRVVIPRYEGLFRELLASRSRRPWESPATPFTYDVQDVFCHYPTGVLAESASLEVSGLGRAWLASPFPLSTLDDFRIEESAVEDALRQVLADGRDATVRSVSDRLLAQFGEIVGGWLVSRLIKYGLLRVTSGAGNDSAVVDSGVA